MSGGLGPGEVFAGHRIEAELGRGGMGIVYLARHIALDRPCAIKVLTPELSADEIFAERFRRESRRAASIEHPNLVTIHGAGEEDGRLYLAMQLIEGTDLTEALRAGPLSPERTTALVTGVAAALDAAHAHGLIHRDVKPANVLLGRTPRPPDAGGTPGADHPYLTDFGISKLAADSDPEGTRASALTGTGAVLGTTDYMSPEQIEGGPLTPRADVYALACVAFHALTGRVPFPRDTRIATMMAHARAERPRPSALVSGLPEAVDLALARGMAIDPEERTASAGTFAGELEAALSGIVPAASGFGPGVAHGIEEDASAARIPDERKDAERAFRRRLGIGLAALTVVAAVALALALSLGGDGSDEGGPGGGASTPVAVDPVAEISIGRDPTAVAVGGGQVWATSRGAGALYRIDPRSNQRDGNPITVAGAKSVALGHGAVWVAGAGTVDRIDPDTGEQLAVEGVVDPVDVTTDDDWVWVTDAAVPGRDGAGPGRLLQVDPETAQVIDSAPVGLDPRAVAAAGGSVWVANAEDGTVTRVDADSVRPLGRPIDAGTRPTNIAAGESAVWVTDFSNAELLRIDPERGEVDGVPVEVGPRPRGVAAGSGSVWVASGELGEVWALDPVTLERRGPVRRVGDDPADIAVGAGGVWTADEGAGTITRSRP